MTPQERHDAFFQEASLAALDAQGHVLGRCSLAGVHVQGKGHLDGILSVVLGPVRVVVPLDQVDLVKGFALEGTRESFTYTAYVKNKRLSAGGYVLVYGVTVSFVP